MYNKLVLVGVLLTGVAIFLIIFFNPILNEIFGLSGTFSTTVAKNGKLVLSTQSATELAGLILGTFIGLGVAIVGLVLTIVGALARQNTARQISSSTG